MKNGFYVTQLVGEDNSAGVTIIEDNRLRGGNPHFLYSGTISSTDDQVTANIRLRSIESDNNTIHMTDRDLEMSYNGEKTENGFEVTGYSPNGREVKIIGKRIASIDLAESI